MSEVNSVHVSPNEDRWGVRKELAKRNLKSFDTKEEAVDYARELAKREELELIIHKKNGQFQRRDSYGNDPFPPKG